MDDFRTEVDEHGNIKVTSYVEAVVISKEEQEQALRTFKQLQAENVKLRELLHDAAIELYVNGNITDGATELLFDQMRELGIEVPHD